MTGICSEEVRESLDILKELEKIIPDDVQSRGNENVPSKCYHEFRF